MMPLDYDEKDGVLVKYIPPYGNEYHSAHMCCWLDSLYCLLSPEIHGSLRTYAKEISKIEREKTLQQISEVKYREEHKLASIRLLQMLGLSGPQITEAVAHRERESRIVSESPFYFYHAVALRKLIEQGNGFFHHWRPTGEAAIAELMKLLKDMQSPLLVAGHFGFNFYRGESAHRGLYIGGVPIYQFPQGSAVDTDEDTPTHNVLLVGVKYLRGKPFVLYVDPTEVSYHDSMVKTHRVCIMSGKLFLQNIYNIYSDTRTMSGAKKNMPLWTSPPFVAVQSNYPRVSQHYKEMRLALAEEAYRTRCQTGQTTVEVLLTFRDWLNVSAASTQHHRIAKPIIDSVTETLSREKGAGPSSSVTPVSGLGLVRGASSGQ